MSLTPNAVTSGVNFNLVLNFNIFVSVYKIYFLNALNGFQTIEYVTVPPNTVLNGQTLTLTGVNLPAGVWVVRIVDNITKGYLTSPFSSAIRASFNLVSISTLQSIQNQTVTLTALITETAKISGGYFSGPTTVSLANIVVTGTVVSFSSVSLPLAGTYSFSLVDNLTGAVKTLANVFTVNPPSVVSSFSPIAVQSNFALNGLSLSMTPAVKLNTAQLYTTPATFTTNLAFVLNTGANPVTFVSLPAGLPSNQYKFRLNDIYANEILSTTGMFVKTEITNVVRTSINISTSTFLTATVSSTAEVFTSATLENSVAPFNVISLSGIVVTGTTVTFNAYTTATTGLYNLRLTNFSGGISTYTLSLPIVPLPGFTILNFTPSAVVTNSSVTVNASLSGTVTINSGYLRGTTSNIALPLTGFPKTGAGISFSAYAGALPADLYNLNLVDQYGNDVTSSTFLSVAPTISAVTTSSTNVNTPTTIAATVAPANTTYASARLVETTTAGAVVLTGISTAGLTVNFGAATILVVGTYRLELTTTAGVVVNSTTFVSFYPLPGFTVTSFTPLTANSLSALSVSAVISSTTPTLSGGFLKGQFGGSTLTLTGLVKTGTNVTFSSFPAGGLSDLYNLNLTDSYAIPNVVASASQLSIKFVISSFTPSTVVTGANTGTIVATLATSGETVLSASLINQSDFSVIALPTPTVLLTQVMIGGVVIPADGTFKLNLVGRGGAVLSTGLLTSTTFTLATKFSNGTSNFSVTPSFSPNTVAFHLQNVANGEMTIPYKVAFTVLTTGTLVSPLNIGISPSLATANSVYISGPGVVDSAFNTTGAVILGPNVQNGASPNLQTYGGNVWQAQLAPGIVATNGMNITIAELTTNAIQIKFGTSPIITIPVNASNNGGLGLTGTKRYLFMQVSGSVGNVSLTMAAPSF